MTALCAGGASEPVPGFSPNVFMSGAAIGALLNNVPTPWAVAFAALVAGVTYDLGNMCATDPPALPSIAASDMLDLTVGPAGGPSYFAALNKFYDFVKYWAWFKFCRCSAVATPAPAAPPSAPVGLPQIDPPVAPPLPALNCGSLRTSKASSHSTIVGVAPLPMRMVGSTGQLPGNGPITVQLGMQVLADSTPSGSVTWLVQWFDGTGALLRTDSPAAVASGGSATYVTTQPVAATQVNITHTNGTTGAINTAVSTVTIFCNGQLPTNGATGCCPPDPMATGLLTQILQAVTLIQRQAVPFAYLSSTVHSGLTGSGNIEINGLIGARIDLTTVPPQLGRVGNLPVELFDAGFVTFGTDDGYPQSYRVEHNPHLLLPPRCSAYTDLSYDLHPGVVATITELVREP